MRWLLLLAACGRVGFDAAGSGDGGGPPGDGAQGVDSTPSGDGGGGGGVGVPPGVTVVGSAGNGGTMVGVGGGAAGELRVTAVAWNPSSNMDVVSISDSAGDSWKQPFQPIAASNLHFAMFYSIASSASDTITATITPAPSNSAIVVATFAGQGAFLGQSSGEFSGSSTAQVLWFPKIAGLGVVGLASDVDIGASSMTPAGMTQSNAIRLRIYGTTANQNTTVPLAGTGNWTTGGFSFQP